MIKSVLLLHHLSHLHHRRQYKGHVKDGCFHEVLLTIGASDQETKGKAMWMIGVSWHILLHLSHLNHRRQYKGHIKDGCFHVALPGPHIGPGPVRQAAASLKVDICISFSTSVISISGGRVKVILKMDVFILVS
jgi:hypothetical protein